MKFKIFKYDKMYYYVLLCYINDSVNTSSLKYTSYMYRMLKILKIVCIKELLTC